MKEKILKICNLCFSVLFIHASVMAADFAEVATEDLKAVARALENGPDKDAIYNELARRDIERIDALADAAIIRAREALEDDNLAEAREFISYANTPHIQRIVEDLRDGADDQMLAFLQQELIERQTIWRPFTIEAIDIPSISRPFVSMRLAYTFTLEALSAIRKATARNLAQKMAYYIRRKGEFIRAWRNSPIADPEIAVHDLRPAEIYAVLRQYARPPLEIR